MGVNFWCARESPDLFSVGMSVPDKKWNASYIHVVYSCSAPDKVEEEHLFSDGMFVPVKEWNVACIHVLFNYARQGGERTLTVFM